MNRQCLQLFVLIAGLMVLAGCKNIGHGPKFDPHQETLQEANTSANPIDPAWLRPSTNEFRLGPGDKLEIDLLGSSESPTPALVGPDGKIYFELLPGLDVWGLTLRQTRDLLAREMAKYVNHPRVSVTLREVYSRRVWMLGRVVTPGIYSLNAPTTLLEAISRAGGLATSAFTGTTEELADLHHSFVMRGGKFLPVDFNRLIYDGDMSQNIYLEPDDFVFLPSASETEVYVLGAVNQPRAVIFKDQVTLSSAISIAGGLLPDAFSRQVVIVRGSLTDPHYAVVNWQDILKGKAKEVRLQPRDIVYVPDEPLEMLDKAGHLILQTFVRTIAANEGLRAGGSTQSVGVGVSVGQ